MNSATTELLKISLFYHSKSLLIYCCICIAVFLNCNIAVILYMSGNSQGVKRPYLGHEIILCNTLL